MNFKAAALVLAALVACGPDKPPPALSACLMLTQPEIEAVRRGDPVPMAPQAEVERCKRELKEQAGE